MVKKSKDRDWGKIIIALNESKNGQQMIEMGSPGSAQVTRCRLLREYRNLRVTTRGPFVRMRLINA